VKGIGGSGIGKRGKGGLKWLLGKGKYMGNGNGNWDMKRDMDKEKGEVRKRERGKGERGDREQGIGSFHKESSHHIHSFLSRVYVQQC
jgi:hypothetical protein